MQVLLPLKEFAAAKQRLAGVLSAAERAQLFQAMVEDVLQVLTQHPAIERIAICSREHSARWLANYYGVEFIDEDKFQARDLNAAVNAAAHEIFARGENDMLVVHGDLPLLSAADLSAFLHAHRNGPETAVTIAPDRRDSGTNLLAWRALPNFIATYGENSFQRHSEQARAFNVNPTICDLPGARCDIDEFDDLLALIAQPASSAPNSLRFLHESGIGARVHAARFSANFVAGGEHHGHA